MGDFDQVVVGGGIVGLATAWALLERRPGARVALVEKEPALAQHQTGHNSGVIHSGLYYRPGSSKARLAVEGRRRLVAFCEAHGIPHRLCGKLVVAGDAKELAQLEVLASRAQANGVEAARLTPGQAREVEPHVSCVGALRVPGTGVVDYRQVAQKLGELVVSAGGELHLGTRAFRAVEDGDAVWLETSSGELRARTVVACAGLHADTFARASGAPVDAEILPFRGEYYALRPERAELVRALIYPVPDPAFPFLGVHLTRGIDGSVHAGPNAVLALAREGYRRTDASLSELREALEFPGLWSLVARHGLAGAKELARSLSRHLFGNALRNLVPALRDDDLVPAPAGVRAQAVRPDGSLVDDFLFVRSGRTLHVCNAPSPAATASLAIAAEIVGQLPEA